MDVVAPAVAAQAPAAPPPAAAGAMAVPAETAQHTPKDKGATRTADVSAGTQRGDVAAAAVKQGEVAHEAARGDARAYPAKEQAVPSPQKATPKKHAKTRDGEGARHSGQEPQAKSSSRGKDRHEEPRRSRHSRRHSEEREDEGARRSSHSRQHSEEREDEGARRSSRRHVSTKTRAQQERERLEAKVSSPIPASRSLRRVLFNATGQYRVTLSLR